MKRKNKKEICIFVYDEKGKVAVTVAKLIDGSSFSKQHIVRWLSFSYKSHYSGELSVGAIVHIADFHKGDRIRVNRQGEVFLNGKKLEASLRQ